MRRRHQRVHLQMLARVQRKVLRDRAHGRSALPADLPLSAARLQARHLLPAAWQQQLHLQMRTWLFR